MHVAIVRITSKVVVVKTAFVKVFAVVMVNVRFIQAIHNVNVKPDFGADNANQKNAQDTVKMVEPAQ